MAGCCNKCHTCGTPLRIVLDGEEWCPVCGQYRRYNSHGWAGGENSPCPPADDFIATYTKAQFLALTDEDAHPLIRHLVGRIKNALEAGAEEHITLVTEDGVILAVLFILPGAVVLRKARLFD